MNSIEHILEDAVEQARPAESSDGRIDWGAYWEHSLELRHLGWPWSRIYLHFDTQLRLAGRKMPGDVETYSKAMSARWKNHTEQARSQRSAKRKASRSPKFKPEISLVERPAEIVPPPHD